MDKRQLLELKNDFVIRENELSDDQLEKLIEEKFIRAREYYKILAEREERLLNELE